MSNVTVYHGGVDIVKHPICHIGRENLDFGQGFYVTDIKEQAVKWAKHVALDRKSSDALLNVYTLDRNTILKEGRCKVFTAYDEEWLEFIVANRYGKNAAEEFDYIEGGIADDRVVNTVNMYMQGYYEKEYTLRLLALHQPNNQICIRKQELADKYLHYERTEIA